MGKLLERERRKEGEHFLRHNGKAAG